MNSRQAGYLFLGIAFVLLCVLVGLSGCTATIPTGGTIPTGSIVNGVATTHPTTATQPTPIVTPTGAAINHDATVVQSVAQAASPYAGFVPYGGTAIAGVLVGAGLVKLLSGGNVTPSAAVQAGAGAVAQVEAVAEPLLPVADQAVAHEVGVIAGQIAGKPPTA